MSTAVFVSRVSRIWRFLRVLNLFVNLGALSVVESDRKRFCLVHPQNGPTCGTPPMHAHHHTSDSPHTASCHIHRGSIITPYHPAPKTPYSTHTHTHTHTHETSTCVNNAPFSRPPKQQTLPYMHPHHYTEDISGWRGVILSLRV